MSRSWGDSSGSGCWSGGWAGWGGCGGGWSGWGGGSGSGWPGTGRGGGSGSGARSGGGGGTAGGGCRPCWEKVPEGFTDDSKRWKFSVDPKQWEKNGVNLFLDDAGGGATTVEALANFEDDAPYTVLPVVEEALDAVNKHTWDPRNARADQLEALDFLSIWGAIDEFQEVKKTAIRRKGQKNASQQLTACPLGARNLACRELLACVLLPLSSDSGFLDFLGLQAFEGSPDRAYVLR